MGLWTMLKNAEVHKKISQEIATVLCQRVTVLFSINRAHFTEIGIAVLRLMISPTLMVSHNLFTHLHQHDWSTMRPGLI